MEAIADDPGALRAGIVSLLEHMRSEERLFEQRLSAAERTREGTPTQWSAKAVLAHIAEFRAEQIVRLEAARDGAEPPEFPLRDHADQALYAANAARSWEDVGAAAEHTSARLAELTETLDDHVLFTAGVFPWLRGRALWAQVLVRGVWHPSAHLHQYLAERGHFERVVELQESVLDAATRVGIPNSPGGRPFALYNLACARSLVGEIEPALDELAEAVRLDPALAAAARDDDDLRTVRADARFETALA